MFAWVRGDILRDSGEVVMSYDLPERETEERMPSGRCYRFRWRGDEITGVTPQDEPMSFYPAIRETTDAG
jgi:hypothetical protein